MRLARKKAGNDLILIFRLSLLDLVEQGSTLDESLELAEKATVSAMSVEAGAVMAGTLGAWTS